VGEVREDGQLGAVGGRGGQHLLGREGAVGAAPDHQHRQLGDRRGLGKVEDHHVEVGEVGLVLQPLVEGADLALAHRAREEHLLRRLGGLHHRPEAHQGVGLEELHRVPPGEAQARHQHARGRHRGEQHRRWGGVGLEVLLDDGAAHRVPDDHRRRVHRGRRGGHVLDVLGEPGPAQPLPPPGVAVAPEVQRLDGPAAVAEVAEEVLFPAPRAMPRAVHEQQRRPHGRLRPGPAHPQPDTKAARGSAPVDRAEDGDLERAKGRQQDE